MCCLLSRQQILPSEGQLCSPSLRLTGDSVRSQRCTPFRSLTRSRALVVKVQNDGERFTVAITGATGLVGSRLVAKLASQGYSVKVLTRNVERAKSVLPYPSVSCFQPVDWDKGIAGAQGVVNLAGEAIGTRWTPQIKSEIKTSRVQTTKRLVSIINSLPSAERPRVLVSSSAIGYYGCSNNSSFNEDSPSGSDYLAEVCREWEAAANEAQVDRVVLLRNGIVLAKDGGALARMLPVFQLFAGGPLGSGKQWCSWIHRDDLVSLILAVLRDERYNGVYNATAPSPVRMSELCGALGNELGRPSWLPVPDFAIQTLLGEGAAVVLDGQKVLPTRTRAEGFNFQYANINDAIRDILRA